MGEEIQKGKQISVEELERRVALATASSSASNCTNMQLEQSSAAPSRKGDDEDMEKIAAMAEDPLPSFSSLTVQVGSIAAPSEYQQKLGRSGKGISGGASSFAGSIKMAIQERAKTAPGSLSKILLEPGLSGSGTSNTSRIPKAASSFNGAPRYIPRTKTADALRGPLRKKPAPKRLVPAAAHTTTSSAKTTQVDWMD